MKEFDLSGVIVPNDDAWIYDWFEIDCTSPAKLKQFLSDAGREDVTININSGGGDVHSGVNMRDMLCKYEGAVTVKVSGFAASAATIVAMGADRGKLFISPASVFMIHTTSCEDYGNEADKLKTAEVLNTYDRGIASCYAERTGKPLDEILTLMRSEKWFTADEAVEQGFADGVTPSTGATAALRPTNFFGAGGLLPRETIKRVREMKLSAAGADGGEAEKRSASVENLRKKLNLVIKKQEVLKNEC